MQLAAPIATGLKIFGAVKGGDDAKDSARAEANAMRKRAAARRAEGHYEAEEERRQARYVYSAALARAAASGGGTGGTTENILADIDAEGEYRALMRRYSADSDAKGLDEAAYVTEKTGKASATAGLIGGATTLFTEGPDLWKKFVDG